MDEQPLVEERTVMIKNIATDETFAVQAIKDASTGNIKYKNMPPEMKAYMINFAKTDILDNFHEVMESATNMFAVTGGDMDLYNSLVESDSSGSLASSVDALPDNQEERKEEPNRIPTTQEFEANLEKYAHFRKDNPNPHYKIIGRLGSGGQAQVFKV